MHDHADTIDADLGILGFAIPQPPAQPLNFLDDHRLRHHPRRIIGRQAAGDLLQVLKSHRDMKPVEDWRPGDAGISENASEPRTTVGEAGQRRVLGSADGIEVPADQHLDIGVGSRDGAKNLATARLRFDIADPYLQMPLPVLTAPDEGRIHGDHDCRRGRSGSDRGTIPKRLALSQGMAAQGLMVLSGVDREHLRQQVSGYPIGHEGGEMRLKLIQLRCRPAMRWPADASLDPATTGTAKSREPHRDQAEKRRYRMVPIVLHVANAATTWATRPPNGVLPGLCGDDLLLEAGQQQLRFAQGQTEIGDIAEIIRPVDLHDVRAQPLALSPGFHHPHNPGHASTPSQRTGAKSNCSSWVWPGLVESDERRRDNG